MLIAVWILFYLDKFYSFSSNNTCTITAKAGLVIKTPTEIPIKVVSANPVNNPAPAFSRGSMAAAVAA